MFYSATPLNLYQFHISLQLGKLFLIIIFQIINPFTLKFFSLQIKISLKYCRIFNTTCLISFVAGRVAVMSLSTNEYGGRYPSLLKTVDSLLCVQIPFNVGTVLCSNLY